jgi:hypothetical protein
VSSLNQCNLVWSLIEKSIFIYQLCAARFFLFFFARSEIFLCRCCVADITPRSLVFVLVRILGGVLSDFALSAWS